MADKSFLEQCEELGVNTNIFAPEKTEDILQKAKEYTGERFFKKIGGTTYKVSTHFNSNGRESATAQFKNLILSSTDNDKSR